MLPTEGQLGRLPVRSDTQQIVLPISLPSACNQPLVLQITHHIVNMSYRLAPEMNHTASARRKPQNKHFVYCTTPTTCFTVKHVDF